MHNHSATLKWHFLCLFSRTLFFLFSKKNETESEKNWLALFCHFNETSGNEADDGGVTRLLKRLRELHLANFTFLMYRSSLSQSLWYCGGGEEKNVPYKRCVFAHAGISQLPKCSRRRSSVSSFVLFFSCLQNDLSRCLKVSCPDHVEATKQLWKPRPWSTLRTWIKTPRPD